MSNVIHLNDFADEWKAVFEHVGWYSSLQVYVNVRTGEAELVQYNDDDEAIRTPLDKADVERLIAALGGEKARGK